MLRKRRQKRNKIVMMLIMCICFNCACTKIPEVGNDSHQENDQIEGSKLERETILKNAKGNDWKIHSDVKIGSYTVSAVYSSDSEGIAFFEEQNDTANSIELKYIYSQDKGYSINVPYRIEGEFYQFFWWNSSKLSSAELEYTVNGANLESIKCDAQNLFYTKVPCDDYKLKVIYYGLSDSVEDEFEIEGWNQRIMVNQRVYENSGKICENQNNDKVDGEIISTVKAEEYPCANDQSNFGIGSKYRIVDDVLEVNIDNKWFVFEPEEK